MFRITGTGELSGACARAMPVAMAKMAAIAAVDLFMEASLFPY
jgi:hypothetical protein